MQQARQEAEGQQADSEKLREAARRLADTMTDEQKQELLEQWMQMQQEQRDDAAAAVTRRWRRATLRARTPATPDCDGRAVPPPPQYEDIDLRDEQAR